MKNLFYLILISLTFTSCGESFLYKKKIKTNPEGWAYQDSLVFPITIEDTSQVYTLLMDVHHNTSYSYQNIYFKIGTAFPSGKRLEQELSSDLARKSGEWYGECRGQNCTASINLQGKAKFNELGEHTIIVKQHSRDSLLEGIKGISIKMKPLEIAD